MKWLKYFESFTKGKWEVVTSDPDKKNEAERLIDLVDTAYRKTPEGSFVKSSDDVIHSNWLVIDYNEIENIDICIFYRGPRSDENWTGRKIQGIGHDGQPESKRMAIHKFIDILSENGTWVEASDKLEEILLNSDCNRVTDVNIIQKLFPNSKVEMLVTGQYKRSLGDKIIQESVFGLPLFK